jgi:hypothetical protein
MNMIKAINETLNQELQILQEVVNNINRNSKNILRKGGLRICESAEGFLGTVIAKLNTGRPLDPNDTNIRNMIGVVTALDLLRYPQARKVVNSNNIRAYLDIINGIETVTTMNRIELKLLHGLEGMKDEKGTPGMDVRARYLEMAKTNPQELLAVIDKLRKQYGLIINKLKAAANTTPNPAEPRKPQYNVQAGRNVQTPAMV